MTWSGGGGEVQVEAVPGCPHRVRGRYGLTGAFGEDRQDVRAVGDTDVGPFGG